jgi:hypothetical protein
MREEMLAPYAQRFPHVMADEGYVTKAAAGAVEQILAKG